MGATKVPVNDDEVDEIEFGQSAGQVVLPPLLAHDGHGERGVHDAARGIPYASTRRASSPTISIM